MERNGAGDSAHGFYKQKKRFAFYFKYSEDTEIHMCVCVFIHMNILIYTEVLNEGISFKIRIRPFHSLEVMKRSDICLKRKTFNCCIENRV